MDVDASATATDEEPATAAKPPPAKEVTEIVPEQDIYLRLLAGLVLLDAKELAKATDLFSSTVELIQKLNRRSLDHLAAKVYFYLGRVFEIQGRDADLRPFVRSSFALRLTSRREHFPTEAEWRESQRLLKP